MDGKIVATGITFDDVLLVPRFSEVVPAGADVSTRLTREIRLNIPIVSSPMDTVTESAMAIALGQEGGMGVIHKNLPIDRQADEVDKVKRSANGIIVDPVTLPPSATVARAREVMDQYNISGVPITAEGKQLAGIITRRDLRFLESGEMPVSEIMTARELVTATGNVTLEQAEKILMANKVEKLLLVDENNVLTGLITIKDIDMMKRFPRACKDPLGRLRAGAAVGVFDFERAESLIAKGVDMLVVDSAHGHSANVLETVREIKKQWAIEVVAGNVATREGCRDLLDAGVDGVKVGIGPGSICTTRVISGVGVPQISAVWDAAQEAAPKGVRGGRACLHDRRAARGGCREPRRDGALPGPDLQGLPGNGVFGGDGQRFERTLSPGTARRWGEARARGGRGPGALQRALEHLRLPARRRAAGGNGLLRNKNHRGTQAGCPIHTGVGRIGQGGPSA